MSFWSSKNKKLFYNYLLSYFAILLLPIIIMCIIIYSYFIGIFKDEIMTNNENNILKVKEIVDTQLLQLKNISDQLHLDNNLSSFNFENEPIKGVTAIKELSKFKLTNSFFQEIILYYKNDNFLYTTSSSNRIDLFTKNIYTYKNWPLK